MTKRSVSTLTMAKQMAEAALKIKAVDLKLLDLRKLTSFTDYFLIASGTSDRHVEAIIDSVVMEMKKKGYMPISVEGYGHSQWVIADFGDVVVHVFYPMMREIYAIEKLWGDANVVKIVEEKIKKAKKVTKTVKGKNK